MKHILFFLLLLPTLILAQEAPLLIEGIVTDGDDPLSKVSVQVQGTNQDIQTDAGGNYTIKAKPGDVLVFKHSGMETAEVITEDVTSTLNIKMVPRVKELEEVVINERRKKTQSELRKEFNTNKRLIRTNFGILDTDRTSYAVRILDGADFNPGFIDILDVLQARFPGIYVKLNAQGIRTAFSSRTRAVTSEAPLLYEVDGVLTTDLPFIPVTEVDRLAVIPGAAGTMRYGTRGAGGVVIVNTKRGGFDKDYEVGDKLGIRKLDESQTAEFDSGLVPDNLRELKESKSVAQAIASFEENKSEEQSPYYFVEAYSYFANTWNHRGKQNETVDVILSRFGDNPVVLKALAYKLEEAGDYETALEVYQKIFGLRPNYEQSYRDVAHAYHQLGESKTALRYYMDKDGFSRFNSNFKNPKEGIDFTMLTELNALVSTKADEFGLKSKMRRLGELPNGTRVLFEWNHGEAEFEIQLVNPKKQYFTWTHTNEKDKARIKDEKMRGYSSEQFFIDWNSKGDWQINLNYLGNKSTEPTYVKVTLWTNFGTSYENKMLKLFRLEQEDINYKLVTFVNDPLVANSFGK